MNPNHRARCARQPANRTTNTHSHLSTARVPAYKMTFRRIGIHTVRLNDRCGLPRKEI